MTALSQDRLDAAVLDWKLRLHDLRETLLQPTARAEAWRIECRIKVLEYLLRRYGGLLVESVKQRPRMLLPPPQPEVSPLKAVRGPRTIHDFLPILKRIAEANNH